MKPTILFAGFTIPTHELFVFLGALAGAIVFAAEMTRRGFGDERLLWIVAGTLMFGALGAKLATVWRYVAVSGDTSFQGMLVRGGRSILGGLAGAYVGAHITKRLVGYKRKTGDLFAPAVALGMAIGRVGCSKRILEIDIGHATNQGEQVNGVLISKQHDGYALLGKSCNIGADARVTSSVANHF